MVLYKRKEFRFIVPPLSVPADTPCWYIPETGEIFPAYESYLDRLSFYNLRRFADQISGESNLTFWEALEKEKQGSKDIDADFPEALRQPILRKCQFSQKSRLSDLVASLYHEFKDNIVAGEQVQFQDVETGIRATGLLKERTVFYDRPDLARYFIQVPPGPGQKPNIACVDRRHIWRKPRTFTKYNLQRFLRQTIRHEQYDGAPWIVMEQYAKQYGLETEVPHHLTRDYILEQRRLHNGLRRNRIDELPGSFMVHNNQVVPRPGHNPSPHDVQYVHQRFNGVKINGEHILQMRPAPQQRQPTRQPVEPRPAPAPAPPPIKYPIEDLIIPPRKNIPPRPALKDLTKQPLFPSEEGLQGKDVIDMQAVGSILETWNTLTVFGEFFLIDGFSLDDFIGAMYIASDSIHVELFDEAHCAVLCRLVGEDGKILPTTLAKAGSAEDDSDSSDDSSASDSESNANNSSSGEDGTDKDVEMKDSVSDGVQAARHRASEMITTADWMEALASRRFSDGGWILIIIGILNRLSTHTRLKDRCEQILSHLAPTDQTASAGTAYQQYMSMSINLRIKALEMLTMLVTETKPFKDHIESLVAESTDTRKEKVSLQSQAKPLRLELTKLEQQEKLTRPENLIGQPNGKVDVDGKVESGSPLADAATDQDDDELSSESDDSDEGQVSATSRRVSNRAANIKKRKRELEERKHTREETQELAEYRKLIKELEVKNEELKELEEGIHDRESELRENSCYRTRLMGRDRFLNRYIWFERNGMPFEGESACIDYGYANGRLWVQGPDPIERPGILDLDRNEQNEYQKRLKMTMQERRDLEEGKTQLQTATDWGFYDTPEDLDKLITWLDAKGEREKPLKKELQAWRKPLRNCMLAMREYLDSLAAEHSKLEDRPVGIATRKKIAAELDRARYPCLQWENLFVREQYSQLLSDGPLPKRVKKARGQREASAQPERRTRQSTRR